MTKLTALLDACVIVPYNLGDTLLRAAASGLYQVYFSERILIEATRNRIERAKNMADSSRFVKQAQSFQDAVMQAFPDAIVEAPQELEKKMTNHPGDRHVLASAIHAQELNEIEIEFIVTRNLKHFQKESLEPYQIKAIHPDDFLIKLCDQNTDEKVYLSINNQASVRKKPPIDTLGMIALLEEEQPQFSTRMLIYAYHDEIVNTCHTILKAGKIHGEERCLFGNTYTICLKSSYLSIIEKDTKRIVLIDDDGTIHGNLRVKDVIIFQEFRSEAASDI